MNFIAGYTARYAFKDQSKHDEILVERSYAGITDRICTKDFNALADWLTEFYPNSFHVAWDLSSFTDIIFTLLPKATMNELATKTKAYYQDTKIFSVDRWLGLTHTKPLHGNFVDKRENNFFGISHWMPPNTDPPKDANEVAKYGEEIISGLDRMGIQPDKLTSPVGVFSDELRNYNLPTIYSNENIIDACEYCLPMMRNEWRSAFKLGFFPEVYSYDMTSAYPSIIAHLPNTDKCKIEFRESYTPSNWAIVYGTIEVLADISPIVYDTGDGFINPKGKWSDYFTKDDINWLLKRKLGTFKMRDGYFFNFPSSDRPYKEPMAKLFAMRDKSDVMVNNLAKRAAQGVSGKLDQDNQDGSLGELYNPIYASMTRSRCRLKLANFIYDNNLLDDVLAVQVDGCESLKEVQVTDNNVMGAWRLDSVSPALIAGKGEIWKPNKKPLNISYQQLMEAIKERPNKTFYQFGDKYIDLNLASVDTDRIYNNLPLTGGELLANKFESSPIGIIMDGGS